VTLEGIATVARQEFRLRIRAGRWKLLLAAFFLVLLGFTALLRAAVGSAGLQEPQLAGRVVYGGLMLFVLGLALLVVPSLSAQSVNGDRERGTLAVVQVTRLSAGEITLGKFLAAWCTALVFLSLTLPLVGYAMTQGGVPAGRVAVVTALLALLLGSVVAVSLWLSATLSRTTTSGVLAYLTVFALTIGTLVVFGLGLALTTESIRMTVPAACPPGDTTCFSAEQTVSTTRTRPDRIWWLIAPNPFVILADAAPRLPDPPPTSFPGYLGPRASDLDPLGQIGRSVRGLRRPPAPPLMGSGYLAPGQGPGEPSPSAPPAVWPIGLAVHALVAGGALTLTGRRLRTPSRTLPRGQRVA